MDHNTQARKAADTMLQNWRNGIWTNPNITREIHLTKIDATYPCPDGCFFEPSSNSRIAIEFKPEERETQRGLLTGVGQCIAYLNKHSAAYLVAPNTVQDNPKIGDYLEKTFKSVIYGKLPIGLITYGDHNFNDLRLRVDIHSRLRLETGTERGLDVNYWAAWRDTPPHSIYLLLKAANDVADRSGRSEKIWNKYYFEDYIVSGSYETLDDVPSNIKMWDGVISQVPLKGIKHKLRRKVTNGEISEAEALRELRGTVDSSGTDNHYRDIKKNHYNFVNHLKLWDEDFNLTADGKKLLEIGNIYGGDSAEFKNWLGSLMLNNGRHGELIKDTKQAISEYPRTPTSSEEARTFLYDFFEDRGYIKTNPNRTTTGVRKFMASEFGVWGHFGILNQNNGRYFTKEGKLSFNEQKIDELEALSS